MCSMRIDVQCCPIRQTPDNVMHPQHNSSSMLSGAASSTARQAVSAGQGAASYTAAAATLAALGGLTSADLITNNATQLQLRQHMPKAAVRPGTQASNNSIAAAAAATQHSGLKRCRSSNDMNNARCCPLVEAAAAALAAAESPMLQGSGALGPDEGRQQPDATIASDADVAAQCNSAECNGELDLLAAVAEQVSPAATAAEHITTTSQQYGALVDAMEEDAPGADVAASAEGKLASAAVIAGSSDWASPCETHAVSFKKRKMAQWQQELLQQQHAVDARAAAPMKTEDSLVPQQLKGKAVCVKSDSVTTAANKHSKRQQQQQQQLQQQQQQQRHNIKQKSLQKPHKPGYHQIHTTAAAIDARAAAACSKPAPPAAAAAPVTAASGSVLLLPPWLLHGQLKQQAATLMTQHQIKLNGNSTPAAAAAAAAVQPSSQKPAAAATDARQPAAATITAAAAAAAALSQALAALAAAQQGKEQVEHPEAAAAATQGLLQLLQLLPEHGAAAAAPSLMRRDSNDDSSLSAHHELATWQQQQQQQAQQQQQQQHEPQPVAPAAVETITIDDSSDGLESAAHTAAAAAAASTAAAATAHVQLVRHRTSGGHRTPAAAAALRRQQVTHQLRAVMLADAVTRSERLLAELTPAAAAAQQQHSSPPATLAAAAAAAISAPASAVGLAAVRRPAKRASAADRAAQLEDQVQRHQQLQQAVDSGAFHAQHRASLIKHSAVLQHLLAQPGSTSASGLTGQAQPGSVSGTKIPSGLLDQAGARPDTAATLMPPSLPVLSQAAAATQPPASSQHAAAGATPAAAAAAVQHNKQHSDQVDTVANAAAFVLQQLHQHDPKLAAAAAAALAAQLYAPPNPTAAHTAAPKTAAAAAAGACTTAQGQVHALQQHVQTVARRSSSNVSDTAAVMETAGAAARSVVPLHKAASAPHEMLAAAAAAGASVGGSSSIVRASSTATQASGGSTGTGQQTVLPMQHTDLAHGTARKSSTGTGQHTVRLTQAGDLAECIAQNDSTGAAGGTAVHSTMTTHQLGLVGSNEALPGQNMQYLNRLRQLAVGSTAPAAPATSAAAAAACQAPLEGAPIIDAAAAAAQQAVASSAVTQWLGGRTAAPRLNSNSNNTRSAAPIPSALGLPQPGMAAVRLTTTDQVLAAAAATTSDAPTADLYSLKPSMHHTTTVVPAVRSASKHGLEPYHVAQSMQRLMLQDISNRAAAVAAAATPDVIAAAGPSSEVLRLATVLQKAAEQVALQHVGNATGPGTIYANYTNTVAAVPAATAAANRVHANLSKYQLVAAAAQALGQSAQPDHQVLASPARPQPDCQASGLPQPGLQAAKTIPHSQPDCQASGAGSTVMAVQLQQQYGSSRTSLDGSAPATPTKYQRIAAAAQAGSAISAAAISASKQTVRPTLQHQQLHQLSTNTTSAMARVSNPGIKSAPPPSAATASADCASVVLTNGRSQAHGGAVGASLAAVKADMVTVARSAVQPAVGVKGVPLLPASCCNSHTMRRVSL